MSSFALRTVFLVTTLALGSGCSAAVTSPPDVVSSGFLTIRNDSRNETIPASSKLEDAPRRPAMPRGGTGGKPRELARRF